jgi:hypothetical protein
MPTLHRNQNDAKIEATELLKRYKVRRAFVVRHERIYDSENLDQPGFEALIDKELPICPNIVDTVYSLTP